MEDNRNLQNDGNEDVTEGKGNERTFTQEDVNRIVQERLAKRGKKDSEELDKRAAELDKREQLLNAKEKLKESGLPDYLMDLIGTGEKAGENIEILKKWKGEIEGMGKAAEPGIIGQGDPIGTVRKGSPDLRSAFGLD